MPQKLHLFRLLTFSESTVFSMFRSQPSNLNATATLTNASTISSTDSSEDNICSQIATPASYSEITVPAKKKNPYTESLKGFFLIFYIVLLNLFGIYEKYIILYYYYPYTRILGIALPKSFSKTYIESAL